MFEKEHTKMKNKETLEKKVFFSIFFDFMLLEATIGLPIDLGDLFWLWSTARLLETKAERKTRRYQRIWQFNAKKCIDAINRRQSAEARVGELQAGCLGAPKRV